jgi:peroxiredoxin
MPGRNRSHLNRKQKSPTLALAFIGAGLVVLGIAAWAMLSYLKSPGEGVEISSIPVRVAYPAPELSLTDLQGNPVSLVDYRGQVVLVNLWATWCPPCKAEMPNLQKYYEVHRQRNFAVIAIEAGEPANEVASFVQSQALTFPVWIDPTLQATAVFRNPGLPSSYLIDAGGTVRLAWAGAISLENLEQYVTPLLEE